MAAEAASPDWNEANRTGSLIEQGTTRRTEFQHQSRPRQHRAYANRDGSWWPVGDLKAGSGESFLIGGFLAVAFFFFFFAFDAFENRRACIICTEITRTRTELQEEGKRRAEQGGRGRNFCARDGMEKRKYSRRNRINQHACRHTYMSTKTDAKHAEREIAN